MPRTFSTAASASRAPKWIAASFVFACAVSAHAAAPSREAGNAALRRACATGALTAYTCARHGITSVAAPAPAAAAAPAETAPVAPAVVSPPSSSPPAAGQAPALAQAATPPSIRPFRDAKGRYDFDIPDGWELKLRDGLTTFVRGDAWMQLRSVASLPVRGDAALQVVQNEYSELAPEQDVAVTLGGRAGRRQSIKALSKGGRASALVVVSAPLPPADELILIAGGEPADAGVIDAGVTAIVRTLRFR